MTALTSPTEVGERVVRASLTAANETPVYLTAGPESLFGIVTRPIGTPKPTAVLCLHAGNQNFTAHRNAMFTRLTRQLAATGYLTLRVDFHGTGDASGVMADRDVTGQTSIDIKSAVSWLLSQGAESVAIVGTCWGGRVALVAAARLEQVSSVYLISPPLRGIELGGSVKYTHQRHDKLVGASATFLQLPVLKRLATNREYRAWVLRRARMRLRRSMPNGDPLPPSAPVVDTDTAVAGLQQIFGPIVARKTPVHVLYGEGDLTYVNLLKHGNIDALKEVAVEVLDFSVAPINVHGLLTIAAQDLVIEYVHERLALSAP